jgi:AraC-like DNA-binding protein
MPPSPSGTGSTTDMGWFRPFTVAPDLADVLACRYVACSSGHHDLLPDGAMDLVWTLGGHVVLCGPDTAGWSFDLAIGRPMAGLRIRPGAAGALFGVTASTLVDRRVPLDDLLGAREERALRERLETAGAAAERLDHLESFVRRQHRSADPTADLAAMVATDPSFGVGSLAAETGVSTRQLRRRFDRAVGYGPAFYARVARLQRFAIAALRHPARGLAELAAAAGYVDQAHLAKDTRDLAGRTPAALVATLPGSSVLVDVRDVDGRSVQDTDRVGASRWAA